MIKRLIERSEERARAAMSIAIAGGSVTVCPNHSDVLMDTGERDHSYSYRVGNARFTAGDLDDLFDSPRDMTDAVKAAINEIGLTSCPRCDKMLED